MVLGQLGTIEPLNGSNYAQWRERIEMILDLSDLDYALQDAYPTESSVEDPPYENKLMQYGINKSEVGKVQQEVHDDNQALYGRDH
jgi:hypothetical protein